MKKVKDLKKWIELYQEVKAAVDEVQLAYEYVKEGIVSEEELDENYQKAVSLIENLEFRNMLRDEADQMSCVLKINSGAGGTESQDWASMLYRMYIKSPLPITKMATKRVSRRLRSISKAIMPMDTSKAKTGYTVWYAFRPIMHKVSA